MFDSQCVGTGGGAGVRAPGAARERAGGGAAAGLPRPLRHNSIEGQQQTPPEPIFRGKVGKAVAVIEFTVEEAARRFGLEHLGFLTLTFADDLRDKREAQRRFNSLASNVLAVRYWRRWLAVWERTKRDVLHAHLLVVLGQDSDIRTGFDFEAVKRRRYGSVSPALRAEWAFLRETLPRYGFGRHELKPIRKTSEAAGAYIGKYLSKDLRSEADAGLRRYSVGKALNVANQHHQSVHAGHWRAAVALFAWSAAIGFGCVPTWDGLAVALGSNWVWRHREDIAAICEAHRRSPDEARRVAAQWVASRA